MRRLLICALVAVCVAAAGLLVGGYFLFNRPQADELTKADAIIVLGGDMDGRIDYGLGLAHEGYADTVVIADSYGEDDREINQACASGTSTLTVICFVPDPFSTRGEAMFTARLAHERGWEHLIVVSWNWHVVRSRFIFEQCFDGELTMRPVPRRYDYNVFNWMFTYAYQYSSLAKAALLGC
ncbi:MAG: YdcF family protein [Mycobacterium sp.]